MARTPMNERSDIPGEASRGKAEHARRLREEPSLSPLLPTRRRALTNPEIPVTSTIPPSIRFLLLPLEIRLAIYTSAISLPSKSFTILQNEQNSLFYHRPLPVSFTREGRRWFTGSWVPTPTTLCPYYRWPVIAPAIYSFTIDDTYPSGVQFESFHPSGREEIRGLLGSCRQIYRELSHHILTTYTFTFHNLFTVIDFHRSLPPRRFDRIHHLQLQLQCPNRRVELAFDREAVEHTQEPRTPAEQTFALISSMGSLKSLHVEWTGYPGSHRRRIELLRPLLVVTHLSKEKFVVNTPWDWVPGQHDLGVAEVPFMIETGNEDEWLEDYRYDFSPDDKLGLDLEGWGNVDGDVVV